MESLSRVIRRLLAAALMALLSHAAFADPPGRVGRLADVQGQVWLYDAETAEWVAAVRNRPLTTGDRLSIDGGARAELRVGSTSLRLAAGTEVELLQLDDERVRVQLHNGLLALRLRTHEAAREFELVTAEGRFRPERAGRYRLDRVDATSSATVWSGLLLFEAPDNAVTLVAGQRADIWNDGRTQYRLVQPQRDAFADEVAASELADERSVSARYVSPEMTGVEELDRYGRWENDAEYGALWVPRAVAPGWAPYRYGHWAWVRPWGWTWVDDAPWGFAPFHYGRWVYQRNVWCWAPGRWVARPVYAPALVAWVGAPGLSVSIGFGASVGWFPLAPREVFVPGYRTSPHYVRNVNVTHVTNITNVTNIINNPNTVVQQTHYRNRGVHDAMTVVPASVVSGRQPVAPARVQLTDPRRGDGRERGVATTALPSMMAAPQIRATPPARDIGAPAARPGAPPAATGHPVGGAARPTVPVSAAPAPTTPAPTAPAPTAPAPTAPAPTAPAPTAPQVIPAPPARAVTLPSIAPQPGSRPARPAVETAPLPEVAARPVVPPVPVAPSTVPGVRPAPPATTGGRPGAAAEVPAAAPPQAAGAGAAPPSRHQRPPPVVAPPKPVPAPASPTPARPVPPAAAAVPVKPAAPAQAAAPAPPPAVPAAAPATTRPPPVQVPRVREHKEEVREKGKAEK